MNIKEETKSVLLVFRVTKSFEKLIKGLKINIADTCRKALEKEVEDYGRTKSKRSR